MLRKVVRNADRVFVPPAVALGVVIAASLSGCAPAADAPMNRPLEMMTASWGPFARQCAKTTVTYNTFGGRAGQREVTDNYDGCIGVSALDVGWSGSRYCQHQRPRSP